jgi:hypothetical protein
VAVECNTLSGVLGSPMWMREVMQGNSEGLRVQGGKCRAQRAAMQLGRH